MIQETRISLNLSGMVLFDPIVLDEFANTYKIQGKDILEELINNPMVGNAAINEGILIPIYSITPWDYDVIVNIGRESCINPDWVVYKNPFSFPLRIISGQLIVSDIYSLLEWNKEYYINFPPKNERVGVDDDFNIPSGIYSVDIIGFSDSSNLDLENRKCGYEFILNSVEKLPSIKDVNINQFNFNVISL